MKKSLFITCALLSAASTAQATSDTTLPSTDAITFPSGTNTLSSGNNYFSWDTNAVNATLENFALTFTIDLAATASTTANYFLISMGGSSNQASGLSVVLDQTPSQFLTLTNGATWYENVDNPAPQLAFSDGGTYTLAVCAGKAYLWAGSEVSQDKLTGGWALPTGIDATLTSGSGGNRVWTNGGKSPVTLNKVTDISAYAVPEPTTATLSLLALAGLAARRRRK